MVVGNSGQGRVFPQEDQVPGGHVALLRGKTAAFGKQLWRIVMSLQQTFKQQFYYMVLHWHKKLLEIDYLKDSSEQGIL